MRILGIAVVVLALAGCTAAPYPVPTPEPISIPTTCEQVMDVNSFVYNIQIAYEQDRFSGVEYTMAISALGRMLAAVDVEPGSDLAVALEKMGETMTDPTSDGYYQAVADVGDLCIAGDFAHYGISVWTGG